MRESYPVTNVGEEVTFNLGALASRNGRPLDVKDWTAAEAAQYADDRKTGWPLLDGAIRPPGNVNVTIQLGVDVATFTDYLVIAAAGGTWTPIAERLPGRFARLVVTDTSNAANDGIYLWYRLASQ